MVAWRSGAGGEHNAPDQGRGARADVGLRATRRAAGWTLDRAGCARSAGDIDDRAAERVASLAALDLPSIAARGSGNLRSTAVRQPAVAFYEVGRFAVRSGRPSSTGAVRRRAGIRAPPSVYF